MSGLFRTLLVLFTLAATPRPGQSQVSDSVLTLLERLVVAGDRSSARVLADSLVATLPVESTQLADVYYWRAATATSAADAERDYLRITVEHPFSKRAPDALLALAQLEFARGNRGAARRRFDMLLRDYPQGKHVARASLWSGRLALEEQDYSAGCATLNSARPLVGSDDVELRNQFDYYIAQCSRIPAPAPAPDTIAAPEGTQPAASGATEFSVQVAAYTARQDATSLASSLKGRGFDVRVVGDQAPYRVRIGRYASRADALSALTRMKSSRVTGIVVEAEPK
jgi:septal ring-binding cell division protein DamX